MTLGPKIWPGNTTLKALLSGELSDAGLAMLSKTTGMRHVYADGTLGDDSNDGLEKSTGTGGSFSVTSGLVTFTGTEAAWTSADIGRLLTILNATSADNHGSFVILSVPAGNQVTYRNALGTTESFTGSWSVSSPKKNFQTLNTLVPFYDEDHVCAHVSGTFLEQGPSFFEKYVGKDRMCLVDGGMASVMMSALGGVGDSFSKAGSVITLTDAGANFTAALVGKTIIIQDVTTIGNGGAFTVTAVPSSTTIQWTNASGATEAFVGTWRILPFDTVRTGTGDDLAFGGGNVTLTDAGAAFTDADKGRQIIIANATTPANNGTFIISSVTSSTVVVFANASGVTEAFTGTWTLGNYVADSTSVSHIGLKTSNWGKDQWIGLKLEILTGAAARQSRSVHANDVAETNSAIPSGTGDSFAIDGATGGNDKFSYDAIGNVVTLTDNSALFTSAMAGKSVVVSGSTTLANDGTYTITAVLNSCQITYVNAGGVSEVGAGIWTVKVSTTTTLTDAGASFLTTMIGGAVIIAGSTTPANDGTYTITDVVSKTQIKYVNATGVAEAFTGTWTLPRKFTGTTTVTLTDFGAQWSPRLIGKKITISGATSGGNSGTFTIASVPTLHTLTYANANPGVPENFPGTWTTENGWITPIRSYSIDPGVGAQFRFVRPKTAFQATATPSNINIKNTGFGTMVLQGIYTAGSNVSIFSQGSAGPMYFVDIVLGSTTATQMDVVGGEYVTFEGTKYSTTTFALLTTTLDPYCGVTSLAPPVSANLSFRLRSCGLVFLRGMIIPNVSFIRQSDHAVITQGCRFGAVIVMDSLWLQGGNAVMTTSGYAITRFGGHGTCPTFSLAGITLGWNAGMGIATGVEISDNFYHALELQRSFLRCSGTGTVLGIKNRKSGVYAWFNSQVSLSTSGSFTGMPTGALGDLSVDGTTQETTWARILSGTSLVDITKQMSLSQKATHLY